MPKKPKPIPAKIKRLIASMSDGQRVVLTLRHSEVGDERIYSYEHTGKPVGEWTINRALEMGLIVPAGDGLFPDLDSQTFRRSNAPAP
jgi:hypothetical protein